MNRIEWLDSLRGIGCIIVLITHIVASDPYIGIYVSGCGKIGVWMFIMLSGFLLAKSIASESFHKPRSIFEYYEKKIVRLYPAYLISICIGWLICIITEKDVSDLLLFRRAYGHFWYMVVIIKFYAIAPVFMSFFHFIKSRLVKKTSDIIILSLLVILIVIDIVLFPYANYQENSIELKWYISVFMIGMLLEFLFQKLNENKQTWMDWLVPAGCIMILIETPLMREILWGFPPSGYLQNKYLYIAVAWSIIMIGIMGGKRCKAILEKSKTLQGIGSISFEVYLVHYLILQALRDLIPESTLLRGVVTIVLSISISIILYKTICWFNKKFNLHKRFLVVAIAFTIILTVSSILSNASAEANRLYVPTYITKINDEYFIVDCWQHRIIFSDALDRPLEQWDTLTGENYIGGHTICSDGELLVLDNTDNSEIWVYKKEQGNYIKQQVFENVTGRPHYGTYDAEKNYFYVISSYEGKIYVLRNTDGILRLIRIERLPEIEGSYVRSISIIDGELYTVSGPKAICRYHITDDHFEFAEEYPVPDDIAGMNQIAKIGQYYYITVNTDVNGSVDAATFLRVKELEELQDRQWEDLKKQFGFVGQPYYISCFDGHYYITEISADKGNGIKRFDVTENKINNIETILYWEDVTELSRNNYALGETNRKEVTSELVDLIIFAGQSNMAGKGESEKAPIADKGFEFRAVSDPTKLYPAKEPFGLLENREDGINHAWDGILRKTGGLVTSFMNAYTSVTNVPVIGVSASEGNTTINQWLPGTGRFRDLLERLEAAKEYLAESHSDQENKYVLRNTYFIWCQGESDGDAGTTTNEYKEQLDCLVQSLLKEGIDCVFIIGIGERADGLYQEEYQRIRNAQEEYCSLHDNCILISGFYGKKRYMKDTYHYTQSGYNQVGTESGIQTGILTR